jgi:hypothetical protein
LNLALTHAWGQGNISGGFRPLETGNEPFDLDHDQRLSVVAGLNYQPSNWFVNLSAIYGSGLTNGASSVTYATGLFDFNQEAHTTPAWILNIGAGYSFRFAATTLEPSLFITNLLDHLHLLKGSYFSGAAWEERRNVTFRLSLHI